LAAPEEVTATVTSETASIRSEASRLATSDLGDEELKVMLIDVVGRDVHELERALSELSQRTPNYAYDRAARLLRAVLEDGPVAPVDEAWADLFEWERALDHRPLVDAYAELCTLEPRLNDLAFRARAWRTSAEAGRFLTVRRIRAVNRVSKAVDRLVGPDRATDDPRLRSPVARKVPSNHLWELIGVV
jgi:hypothetical protein